jgi:hypothetical protein
MKPLWPKRSNRPGIDLNLLMFFRVDEPDPSGLLAILVHRS